MTTVACVTIAFVDTAPMEKQVAVLILRAATKRYGPAQAAIAAGVEYVAYVTGKPTHGVQPCASSSAIGTLYRMPEKGGGSALGDGVGDGVWLGVTLDEKDTVGVMLGEYEIVGVTEAVFEIVGVMDGVDDDEG